MCFYGPARANPARANPAWTGCTSTDEGKPVASTTPAPAWRRRVPAVLRLSDTSLAGDRALWAGVVLALLLTAAALLAWGSTGIGGGDLDLYERYATAILGGEVPYLDVAIEYPPGALLPITVAGLLAAVGLPYPVAYALLAAAVLAPVLAHRARRRGVSGLFWAVLLLIPALPFAVLKLDVFVATGLYATLVLAVRGRAGWAAFILAALAVFKGYPLLALPPVLAVLPAPQRLRFLLQGAGWMIIGMLPFLLTAPTGLAEAFLYHGDRPLQIESGPAAIALVAAQLGAPVEMVWSFGSFGLSFPGVGLAGQVSTVLTAVALLTVAWFTWPSAAAGRPATALVVLLGTWLILFKVGSPQLVVPLLAVGLLAGDEHDRAWTLQLGTRLFGISLLLLGTVLAYPLLLDLHWLGALLVVTRHLLLLELTLWVLRGELRRRRAVTGDPEPVPSGSPS